MVSHRAPKGFNEMTLVLLNDINDSHMPHLFFVHVYVIMELRRFGKLHSETKQTTKLCKSSVLSALRSS